MTTKSAIRGLHVEAGCISCGMCAYLVPEAFEVPAGGTSQVRAQWAAWLEREPEGHERLCGARDSCPVSVIAVELDAG